MLTEVSGRYMIVGAIPLCALNGCKDDGCHNEAEDTTKMHGQ